MKKISIDEMQNINGGVTLQFMCFSLGAATVMFIHQPLTIYRAWPAIKYCWNN